MNTLAEKVLGITVEYIGPAAERFLDRQTKSHLAGLNFTDLEKGNLAELAKWVKVSASLLIDNSRAQELAEKISKA
jgi:hypothetical protein